jgi:hypothetical protein
MPSGFQLTPITVDIDKSFEPRLLGECLRMMPLLANICRERRTLSSLVDACDICRSGWAAYLQQWTEDPQICRRKDIEVGLKDCLDAVAAVAATLTGKQRRLADDYADNIRFRLHLVTVLHDQGATAAKAEMRRHQEELAQRG